MSKFVGSTTVCAAPAQAKGGEPTGKQHCISSGKSGKTALATSAATNTPSRAGAEGRRLRTTGGLGTGRPAVSGTNASSL